MRKRKTAVARYGDGPQPYGRPPPRAYGRGRPIGPSPRSRPSDGRGDGRGDGFVGDGPWPSDRGRLRGDGRPMTAVGEGPSPRTAPRGDGPRPRPRSHRVDGRGDGAVAAAGKSPPPFLKKKKKTK